MNFIVWIISGIIAGWLTGLVVRGRGFGITGDLIVGLVGGACCGSITKFYWAHYLSCTRKCPYSGSWRCNTCCNYSLFSQELKKDAWGSK
ncbi:MAG: GlsB/YeaQ/YmgE family stress response membrane protein [Candidatus Brocadia sinica]|nr:GlsB/YeaQ/YmgE family stress response membrane protein [Candidatus Brocadia sinica]